MNKSIHTLSLLSAALILTALGTATSVFAADSVPVAMPTSAQVQQDRKAVHQDTQQLRQANEAIQQDKAAGDQGKLVVDRKAKRELKHKRHEDFKRLKADKAAVKSGEAPAPVAPTQQ